MQMAQCHSDLSDEESSLLLFKALNFDEMTEEFTSLNEAHDKIDSKLILENEFHVHDERVIYRVKNVFFKLDILILLVIDNNIFPDALHCIDHLCLLMLH